MFILSFPIHLSFSFIEINIYIMIIPKDCLDCSGLLNSKYHTLMLFHQVDSPCPGCIHPVYVMVAKMLKHTKGCDHHDYGTEGEG